MPPHLEKYRAQAAKLGLSETEETAVLIALWNAVELMIDHSFSGDYPQETSQAGAPTFPKDPCEPLGLTHSFNDTEEAP